MINFFFYYDTVDKFPTHILSKAYCLYKAFEFQSYVLDGSDRWTLKLTFIDLSSPMIDILNHEFEQFDEFDGWGYDVDYVENDSDSDSDSDTKSDPDSDSDPDTNSE